jgi:hypothetical protein
MPQDASCYRAVGLEFLHKSLHGFEPQLAVPSCQKNLLHCNSSTNKPKVVIRGQLSATDTVCYSMRDQNVHRRVCDSAVPGHTAFGNVMLSLLFFRSEITNQPGLVTTHLPAISRVCYGHDEEKMVAVDAASEQFRYSADRHTLRTLVCLA